MDRDLGFDLADLFTEAELAELTAVLGLDDGDVDGGQQVVAAVRRLTLTALLEYKAMVLGGGLPTRAAEIREQRLYHLIETFFEGDIPTEGDVSRLFHENPSRCKTMLRNVLTRYGRELEGSLARTLRSLLETAEQTNADGDWRLVIQSDNALERLNRIIASEAPKLDPVRKVRNSARVYEISPDSYEVLRDALDDEVGDDQAPDDREAP